MHDKCGAAMRVRLTCTSDNKAFNAALTCAHGVCEIIELMEYGAQPEHRLIRVNCRFSLICDDDFKIALGRRCPLISGLP